VGFIQEETGLSIPGWIKIGLGTLFVVMVLFLAYLLWGFITLPARSATGVAERVAAPDAVLANYEWFFDTYNSVKGGMQRVQTAQQQLNSPGLSQDMRDMATVQLTGAKNYVIDLVNQYNSSSSKLSRNLFKDRSLPHRLNLSFEGSSISLSEDR